MNRWSKIGFLFFCLLIFVQTVEAQSRVKNLRQRSTALRKEIRATSSMLKKTKKEKTQALNRLLALNVQIKSRTELVDALVLEVDSLNTRIFQNTEIVDVLSKDLESLKIEYAKIMQNTLRYKYNKSPLLFLFSADSFNQAFKRWLYLRQYNRYRSQQVEMVAATSRMLQKKVDDLSTERNRMELLLTSIQSQSNLLEKEKSIKYSLVKNLKKNAKSLRKKIAQREREQKALNSQISSMIANAERKSERKKSSKKIKTKPEVISTFHRARGKLSWPVDGYITGFFGKHPHPSAPKVMIANNGVDIRINGDATVKAVYQGEVMAIEGFTGNGLTILIKHGQYYTLYANLSQALVQVGQKVNTFQPIGIAAKDSKNYPTLHFELWKGKVALNPVRWLRK